MGWEEKREYKRAYVKVAVEYRGKNFWQIVEAQDISAGGMFLSTDKIESNDTKIEVMFTFGGNKKKFIHAEAVVVWGRPKVSKDENGNILPAGMGIKFTKFLPFRSKDLIDEAIKEMEDENNG